MQSEPNEGDNDGTSVLEEQEGEASTGSPHRPHNKGYNDTIFWRFFVFLFIWWVRTFTPGREKKDRKGRNIISATCPEQLQPALDRANQSSFEHCSSSSSSINGGAVITRRGNIASFN